MRIDHCHLSSPWIPATSKHWQSSGSVHMYALPQNPSHTTPTQASAWKNLGAPFRPLKTHSPGETPLLLRVLRGAAPHLYAPLELGP